MEGPWTIFKQIKSLFVSLGDTRYETHCSFYRLNPTPVLSTYPRAQLDPQYFCLSG